MQGLHRSFFIAALICTCAGRWGVRKAQGAPAVRATGLLQPPCSAVSELALARCPVMSVPVETSDRPAGQHPWKHLVNPLAVPSVETIVR